MHCQITSSQARISHSRAGQQYPEYLYAAESANRPQDCMSPCAQQLGLEAVLIILQPQHEPGELIPIMIMLTDNTENLPILLILIQLLRDILLSTSIQPLGNIPLISASETSEMRRELSTRVSFSIFFQPYFASMTVNKLVSLSSRPGLEASS